jgi:hypothetical protein
MKKICATGKVIVNVWLMGVYNLNLCFAALKKGVQVTWEGGRGGERGGMRGGWALLG